MKSFTCVVLLIAVVAAEPPRYRQARYRFERQEVEKNSEAEGSGSKAEDAPYPAASFKPTKEFNLPSRQEFSPPAASYGVPARSYGAPLNTYIPPQSEYGAPKENEGKSKESKDKEEGKSEGEASSESVSLESEESSEKRDKSDKKEKLQENKDAEIVSAQGAYYVLLPGSQLQRVQFQTENDLSNMAYTARLQYKEADRAPLYVYTSVPQYQPSVAAAYYQLI